MQRFRSIGLVEGAIALVGLSAVTLVFFATRLTTATVEPTSSWERALGQTGTTVSVSHVWLEEAISGDATIDVPRQCAKRARHGSTLLPAFLKIWRRRDGNS